MQDLGNGRRSRAAATPTMDVILTGPEVDRSADQTDLLMLVDHAERIAGLGSWRWTPQTGEMLWSDNLFRLFGLVPRSCTLTLELVLSIVHPSDRGRIERALPMLGTPGHEVLEYRIVLPGDAIRTLRVRVACTEDDSGDLLVGSVQDVTSECRVDCELAARVAVSKALDEWDGFGPGAQALLSGIGGAWDQPLVVLWVPELTTLTAKVVWHRESPALEALADAIRGWHPGRGSATLGRAWGSREPVVCNEPGAGVPAAIAAALGDAAIKAVVAIPAVAVDETMAVLEMLSTERFETSDRLLGTLNGIGHEVGYFLGRRRGELVDAVLTSRETQVLQMAAGAVSAATIAETLHLSPATVKRHFERAYAQLDVSDRASAVAEAMRRGLIS